MLYEQQQQSFQVSSVTKFETKAEDLCCIYLSSHFLSCLYCQLSNKSKIHSNAYTTCLIKRMRLLAILEVHTTPLANACLELMRSLPFMCIFYIMRHESVLENTLVPSFWNFNTNWSSLPANCGVPVH